MTNNIKLTFTKEKIEEARSRASMAAMVDVATFVKALNDITKLTTALDVIKADYTRAAGELLVSIPEPGTDAFRLLLANGLLNAKISVLTESAAKLDAISGLVSFQHGDDDRYDLPEDEMNDLPEVITVKRIFKILDGEKTDE